ncbi:Asp23/Gls24 family envelope stress response protein [Actinomadura sp. NAK00032]|uniref:Asp23/Gls24 family envelope stress response protein n=1 Tax=Actinomadura sp. NAK00032 TaxID=2742128 RepID=UPI001592A6BF|nr:Asp23/Gls24 family envelope stress response protein [Actinomadura sp. NAK00032]QKW35839.1 Asp23/Gls24 family envelope stress response protein [Actinomadura sp. NAK00032]
MTGLDRRQTGGGESRPDPGAKPFFPGAPDRATTVPPPGTPLPAPPAPAVPAPAPAAPGPAAPAPAAPGAASAPPMTLHGTPSDVTVAVEGRVTIDDAVLAKIAELAAQEVAGVAGLAPAGARIAVGDEEATVDVAIAVEYGTVIKDVAAMVQGNVARVAGLMLGSRVAAVNVSVADVRMPAPSRGRGGAGQTPRA